MASSANATLIGIEYMDAGDKVNTWGTDTQTDNLTVLVNAVHGVNTVTLTGDTTVSETNFATNNETENKAILFAGSLSSAANYTMPARKRVMLFNNSTGQNVTPKTSGGSGFAIPTGYMAWAYNDGVDVYSKPLFVNGTVRATAATNSGDLTTLNQVSSLIAAASVSGDGSFLVSADDTTRKFAEDVFDDDTSGQVTIAWATQNGGANETLKATATLDEGGFALTAGVLAIGAFGI